jgi:GT2 family glycosyltransferase
LRVDLYGQGVQPDAIQECKVFQKRKGIHIVMKTLSVIIVSWNTCELLTQCLNSVFESTKTIPLDVWVVDNASKDGSPDMVRRLFPQVKIIENPGNVGFAKANNQAIEQSSGNYVVLLNPDTIVKPGALDELAYFLDIHPQAGAVGPYLLSPDGSLQRSCYPFPTLSREFWRLLHLDLLQTYGVYDMSSWDHDTAQSVDAIQGACLMLRRETLDQTGLLDPSYFMYTEEVDLCYRIKKAGWDLYWVPQGKVIHFGGQSTRQIAPRMFISLYQTKVHFFRKNYGKLAVMVYKLILFFASIIRLLFSPFVYLSRKAIREQGLYLARRYLDLITALPRM